MKKMIYFLLSVLMIVPLSACVLPSPSPTPTASALSEAEALTLYIGLGEEMKEVPCNVEKTPEAVIAALAEETGWDLSLEYITEDSRHLTIALAADSSIYTAPPESQKEAYHVFDAEDWVYTVLDSMAKTLTQNFDLIGVMFASPDGGDVDAGNEFVTVHFNSNTYWDYKNVLAANKPLPEDSIGLVSAMPRCEIGQESLYLPGGIDEIHLTFMRPEVQIGKGKLIIYNEDGSIFDSVTTDRIEIRPITHENLSGTHYKTGTSVIASMNKILEPSKTYFVSVDAGTFVCGTLSSKAFLKETWPIVMSDYGITSDTFPADRAKTVKIGQPISYQVVLGETAAQCEVTMDDPTMADATPATLTTDGVITITPKKAGALNLHIIYTFKATGEIMDTADYVTVIE